MNIRSKDFTTAATPDLIEQKLCSFCFNRFMYEDVSKSPRTMLITRKSLVVHEFPARVCCGRVL